MESIFITQDDDGQNDLSKKITFTNVMETIPQNSTEVASINWKEERKTEWRWRFMEFSNNHKIVEISYQTYNSDRHYFNKFGNWVKRDIPNVYNNYVIKEYYYYSNE
jgi:hypothetical protein